MAVGQDDFGGGALQAGCGEQLSGRDQVEDTVVLAQAGVDRDAGEDAVVGAGHDDVAAGGNAPGGNEVGQQALQALDIGNALRPAGEVADPVDQQVGNGGEWLVRI